jgi:hypothetical protein
VNESMERGVVNGWGAVLRPSRGAVKVAP